MKNLLARLHLDGFLLSIFGAVVLASVLPARGVVAHVLGVVIFGAIALLFFFYGVRLSPREAAQGLLHWRLHGVILSFTYVFFPLLGMGARPLIAPLVGEQLAWGFVFLCLVPSTVQSSIAFTSLARGNVAGAIVSASFSNLLGVLLTPLLVLLLMNRGSGLTLSAGALGDIALQVLVPFAVGQLSRPLTARWMATKGAWTKRLDQGAIVLVVYTAFAAGVVDGVWSRVSLAEILWTLVVSTLVLALVLGATWVVAQRLGFSRADAIAIQFCGSKKSLATGVPMASVLFGPAAGALIIPLMVFHQIQLIACSVIATKRSRAAEPASA